MTQMSTQSTQTLTQLVQPYTGIMNRLDALERNATQQQRVIQAIMAKLEELAAGETAAAPTPDAPESDIPLPQSS